MSLPLKRGSKDPQSSPPSVRQLQRDLNTVMKSTLKVDGYFGLATETVVKNFQRKAKLKVDGIVGRLTWAALQAAKKPPTTTTPPPTTVPPTTETTPPPTEPTTPPPTTTTPPTFAQRKFGAYVEDGTGGTLWTLTSLNNMEAKLGAKLDIVSGFCTGGDLPDLVSNMQTAVTGGRDVLLSYDLQWTAKDIIAGVHDSTMMRDINATKQVSVSRPVVLRLWAEMNGNWATWSVASSNRKVTSTAEWIAAWKHIVDLYRTNNANAKFMWCPNVTDEGAVKLESYYPGSAYVDLLGFDGYNWVNPWQTHTQVFTTIYNRLIKLHPSMDIWIGETASGEGNATQKATWVTDFLKDTAFPRIKAVAWFSVSKERSWQMDSSPSSLEAFKRGLA